VFLIRIYSLLHKDIGIQVVGLENMVRILTVLVLGGAGFLGRRVVRRLFETGEGVRVLDLVIPPEGDRVSGAEYVAADAREFGSVYSFMRGVDTVVNLAALTRAPESVVKPHTYLYDNIRIHMNVLEAARRLGIGLVVLASSAAVYGDLTPPHREDGAVKPINPYGVSKLTCEMLGEAYYRVYGVRGFVLRYFNILGEGGHNVLSEFVSRLAAGRPPIVRGVWRDGGFVPASRDFIYVEDAAKITVASLKARPEYEVINVGSGEPRSVEELARIVVEEMGNDIEPERQPLLPREPLTSFADITKARARLGWSPETSLREIVKRYVEWFRREREKKGGSWG